MFTYLFTSEEVVVLTPFVANLNSKPWKRLTPKIVGAVKTRFNPGPSFCRWRN